MSQIGKYNKLKIKKEVDFGMYLDGGEDGEILLPRKYVPQGAKPGDEIEVFLYLDSEDRIIATTMRPYATVGEFAYLRVSAVNGIGAFLDWGLPKELLVPFRGQRVKMKPDKRYIVYIYHDMESGRIAASAKIEKYLGNIKPEYKFNAQVKILVYQKTDIGYKVIVDNLHRGMIYENELYSPVQIGEQFDGYVKRVRPDGKIDITVREQGYGSVGALSEQILAELRRNRGELAVTDASSPEQIAAIFGCSKKSYKKAIGALYKEHKIEITPDKIKLRPRTEK